MIPGISSISPLYVAKRKPRKLEGPKISPVVKVLVNPRTAPKILHQVRELKP